VIKVLQQHRQRVPAAVIQPSGGRTATASEASTPTTRSCCARRKLLYLHRARNLQHLIALPDHRLKELLGEWAMTADTALRLARYFGTSPEVWMRLQAQYDLEVAQRQIAKRVEREVKVLAQVAV
jgi:addiction module HigA family antidote